MIRENVNIKRGEGRACLAAMRKIADGEHATVAIDKHPHEAVGWALREIGWLGRDRDYFAYERAPRDPEWLPEYNREHALVALALCYAISQFPKNSHSGGK